MATGLLPILYRLVRAGVFVFVHDTRQWAVSLVTITITLYFALATTFVLDEHVTDTVASTMLPWSLLALYLFFPIGLWLLKIIRWGFRTHILLGVLFVFILGGNALMLLGMPFFHVFLMGNLGVGVIVACSAAEAVYGMLQQQGKIWIKMLQTVAVFFVASLLAMPIDLLLGFFTQYEQVAAHAVQHMPANITVTVGEPFSIHYFLWQGVCMVILYALLDLIRIRPIQRTAGTVGV